MSLRSLIAALAICLIPALAWAQGSGVIVQSGSVTPGHAPVWVTNGVLGDAGGAGGTGVLTEIGITGPGGLQGVPPTIAGDCASWGDTLASVLKDSGSPCFGVVPTTTALKAVRGGVINNTVYRAGLTALGDGGGATYNWQSANCSLNSGAGDNELQVAATGGGCWIKANKSAGALTTTLSGSSIDSQVSPFYQIAITPDTASVLNGCAPVCLGIPTLALEHVFGGTGAGSGGREGLWVSLTQNGAMPSPNTVPFHTGIFSNVLMSTGNSDGSNVYGYAAQVADKIGGHYVLTGGEIDISAHANNSRVEGWSVASAPLAGGPHTNPGTLYDAGYGLWAAGTCGPGSMTGGSACAGFSKGFSFGRDDSYFPVGQHGTMIGVTKGVSTILAADWGINFVASDGTPIGFTFCAFNSNGVCINGGGDYIMTKPFPQVWWKDTQITNPAINNGIWRITTTGSSPDSLIIQVNTAVAGDFSTALQPIGITSGGFFVNTAIVSSMATPPTSTSACISGTIQFDATYIYTCVATNTWHRVANGTTW